MNETAGKAPSCLAMTEKRQASRPGGCVGIFFQLFDWHRRFAKKKLFSRKLLPPARAKQVSRKFHGDEKMPMAKLQLIADENRGGFPHLKKDGSRCLDLEQKPKHETPAPGLVARLMGLESMPAVRKKVVNKTSSPCETHNSEKEKQCLGRKAFAQEDDSNLESRQLKHELRPQKLQKTGLSDRRPVTRFGAEALQIKGVLTKSRKHHHPKLVSPVKSPRITSAKNAYRTSRLIDAATKILEPGLQTKNRVKCALPYSSSLDVPSNQVVSEERSASGSPDVTQSQYSGVKSSGQSSCKNCGNLVDVVNVRPNMLEKTQHHASTASNPFDSSCQGFQSNKLQPVSSAVVREERDVPDRRRQEESATLDSPQNHKFQAHKEALEHGKPIFQESSEQCYLPTQNCNPQKEESPSKASNNSTGTQNEMSEAGRIPQGAKYSKLKSRRTLLTTNSSSGPKDFVALNRSLSGQTRLRVPVKTENFGPGAAARKSHVRRVDSASQFGSAMQKMRTVDVDRPAENPSFVGAAMGKQKNVQCDVILRKKINSRMSSRGEGNDRSRMTHEIERMKVGGSNSNGVVSFTFNSPLRRKPGICEDMEDARMQKSLSGEKTKSREPVLENSDDKVSWHKESPWNGDALGALLERKLKELTAQEEDELSTACGIPKQSTAMILQELIAALTAEQPLPGDCEMFNCETTFKKRAKMERTLARFPHDVNYFCPGSVLEASFSNDSCISSSLDDNAVLNFHLDFMDLADHQQRFDQDADLLDSATSLDNGRSYMSILTDLIDKITRLISDLNFAGCRLAGNELTHAKDVILHAEMLFADLTRQCSDGMEKFTISHILLDKLDNPAATVWTELKGLIGIGEAKGNRLRRFLFDCLLECFDSKYRRYCIFGYEGWTRQLMFLTMDKLYQDIETEVRRWACFAGMAPDEMIEYEMSCGPGKWIDFDIEAFEKGAELGEDIVSALVEEIVTDLLE